MLRLERLNEAAYQAREALANLRPAGVPMLFQETAEADLLNIRLRLLEAIKELQRQETEAG